MKLIWHIIKKDVRYNRWALLLYGFLFVVQAGLGFALLQNDGADKDWVTNLQRANTALVILQFGLGYILVTRFVQADEITGTQMFWVTRPISARRLLAAKALGVSLFFGMLPVLLLLPWWFYNDFGGREIAWTAVETLGWQLLMIAPAFLVASLTDELGRVLMWTLLLVTGLVVWIVFLQAKLRMSLADSATSWQSGVMFTRLWLGGAVLVTGATVIAVHQYLTRRFARSVVMTMPVMVLIVLIGQVWPADWSGFLGQITQPKPASSASVDSLAGVQLELWPAHLEGKYARQLRNPQSIEEYVYVTLRARGVPAGFDVRGHIFGQTLRWPDVPAFAPRGTTNFSSWSGDAPLDAMLSLPSWREDPETMRWYRERFGESFVHYSAPDGITLQARAIMPDALIARIRTEPPAYAARVQCEFILPQIVVELPAKAGTRRSAGSQSYRVMEVSQHKTAAVVQVLATVPSLKKNGIWFARAMGPTQREMIMDRVRSVNRGAGYHDNAAWDQGPTKARVGGVVISWDTFVYDPPKVVRNRKWVIRDQDWFDHTTLVLFSYQPVARLMREVNAEKFELAPINPQNSPEKSEQDEPL